MFFIRKRLSPLWFLSGTVSVIVVLHATFAQEVTRDAQHTTEGQQNCGQLLSSLSSNAPATANLDLAGDVTPILDKLKEAMKKVHLDVETFTVAVSAQGSKQKQCCDPSALKAPLELFSGSGSGSAELAASLSVPGTAFDADGEADLNIHSIRVVSVEIKANVKIDAGKVNLKANAGGSAAKYEKASKCDCLKLSADASLDGGIEFGPQLQGKASISWGRKSKKDKVYVKHEYSLADLEFKGIVVVDATLNATGNLTSKGCGGNGADGKPHGSVSLSPVSLDSDLTGTASIGPFKAQTPDWKPNKPIVVYGGTPQPLTF